MIEPALLPAENMALTVARSQSGRGDHVPPNTAAVLILTIDRLIEDNDRLRSALEPFASISLPSTWSDIQRIYLAEATHTDGQFAVGDVRAAAAALGVDDGA